MKFRLAVATAVVGALALSMSGAQAATPVMDGKKVKVLKITANAGLQSNDKDAASTSTIDHSICTPPRCAKIKFVYKPAKGAKGGLMFTMGWNNSTVSDLDLYVYSLDKRGNGTDIGHCGGPTGKSEKVYVPANLLKSGTTYVMVMDFFRSVNESAVNGKVEMGIPSTIATTVPEKADGAVYQLNCGL